MSYPVLPVVYAKKPDWVRVYDFDFSLWAEFTDTPPESVASATVTCMPPGLTLGAPAVSGARVQVQVSGGTQGVSYTLTCAVVTSPGNYDVSQDGVILVV